MAQGAATASDVQSSSWSLMLDQTAGNTPGAGIGQIVQGIDDINQCLVILLLTMPGQDPLRPTFGCDILSFMDLPLPIATSKIINAVNNAIRLWEPRVNVLSVTVQQDTAQLGALQVTVNWAVNLGVVGNNPYLLGSLANAQQTVVTLL